MLSHNGINESSTRGLRPNSTPVRRKRRTTHSHGLGPDARSCPHCGRTFKRTEHLDRHVRTRQSSPCVCFTHYTPRSEGKPGSRTKHSNSSFLPGYAT